MRIQLLFICWCDNRRRFKIKQKVMKRKQDQELENAISY